jgi:lysozyme family protein
MADINLYLPKLLRWEGGYVNDPADAGGATNKGVTLTTWRNLGYDKDGDGDIDANDIKLLSNDDAKMILKVAYWDRWKADSIKNQSIAESLVEWVWGSGKWGIVIPQRILGVTPDGIVGMKTITAINSSDSQELHNKIKLAKEQYIDDICKSSVATYERKVNRASSKNEQLLHTNERFRQGWLNRIRAFTYQP